MRIREAKDSDLKYLPFLLRELGYEPGDKLEKIYGQIIHSEFMGILVAENTEGQIDGFLSFSFKPQLRLNGTSLEVDELVVSTRARGQGIGKSLLDAVKQRAKDLDCSRIILSTNRDRESYQRDFYIKNGFIETGSAFLKIQLK